MASTTLLREAIAAVKAGQRQYARELFLELVELEPINEIAWIWLSGLLERREDQIIALENSIIIGKGGANLESRLKYLGDAETSPEAARLRKALAHLEKGNRVQGTALLRKILGANPDNERAWMAMANVAEDGEQQVTALEHVLRINPNNFKAREKLTTAQHLLYKKYLGHGRSFQQQGELTQAVEAYKLAENYASSGSFKAAARQRWELVESKGSGYARKNPTIMLIRLAAGPPLLFALLLLIQSGLKPWQLSPFLLYCLGGLMVTLGSLMAVGSIRVPHHPIWVRNWGPDGLTDPGTKSLIRWTGILLALIPFAVWLVHIAQERGLIGSTS